MKLSLSHSRGFTLVEILIVISIIGILMTMSLFPFKSYMDRSALRQSKDEISQEWILSHKAVRNGLQFEKDDINTPNVDEWKHAFVLFAFEPKSSIIELSLVRESDPSQWIHKKPYKTIELKRGIEVIWFSGSTNPGDILYYLITPPYASGTFYENTTALTQDDVILTIGYPWYSKTSGRQKEIYLRPYLH